MIKSDERKALEVDIIEKHQAAFNVAVRMTEEELGITEEDMRAESFDDSIIVDNKPFVERMQAQVIHFMQQYREAYSKLEELGEREGYPAMQAYAHRLDYLEDFLPYKDICHYPFSGVDFYWARIFQRTVFEDMAFDEKDYPNNWWNQEMYTKEKRREIISLMRRNDIIPNFARIELLAGDADVSRPDNQFNHKYATLLVKGGHDLLGFLKNRFEDEEIEYGSIISVTPANPREILIDRLREKGYTLTLSMEGSEIIAPFGMEFGDTYIFQKGEDPF